jgi:hypothetical protein
MQAREVRTKGKKTTELTMDLINPQRLPTESNEQRQIGAWVATLLKNTLEDPNSITDYKIIFTNQTVNGAVTKSNYISYLYKSMDLKNNIQIVSVGDQFDSSTAQAFGKTVFTRNDSSIASALSYYNNVPGSAIKLNVYKQTDSGLLQVMSRDQGRIASGNNYIFNTLKTVGFYNTGELGSGKYLIEYLVSDTSAGAKNFELQ